MYKTQEHNNFIYTFRQYKYTIFNKHRKGRSNNKKKTCNYEQIEFLCVQTPFQGGTLYHLKGSLFQINQKTANDKQKIIAIINLCL